jgi:hypothetical protein
MPTECKPSDPPAAARPAPSVKQDRLAREAAALRANLLKRKQQARERDKPAKE